MATTTGRQTARHYIAGRWEGSPELPITSPADTTHEIGAIPLGDAEVVGRAVAAALEARQRWVDLGPIERGNRLYEIARRLESHVDELAELAAREMGKPIGEARGEALRAVAIFRYYAGEGARPTGEVIPSGQPSTLQYTERVPLGVVGVITPWNFPLAIPAWKIAPALAYGNTVVFKPAEYASLTAYRMVELMVDVLPPGVLNLVLGRGSEAGEALISSAELGGVSFTGSLAVGRHIAVRCAQNGVKYQLEMGGKNPVIVAKDADLTLAVRFTVSGAMRSAGQKCTATSRVIVERPLLGAFRDALVAEVRRIKVGDPLSPDTYLGPLASEAQLKKVSSMVEEARHQGGRVLAGGERLGGEWARGYFYAPTVFDVVDPSWTVAQEEIFGPVVVLLAAEDMDHAIALANGVKYGLSASVFTRDLSTALYAVKRLEAGLVRVNEETTGVEYQAPFGGMKASSSHSREQGQAAKEFYTEVKTIAIRTF